MDHRLEKLRGNLESAVEGMSSGQLDWHPPGKWCAAEVLEHLYLTYTGTIAGFERLLRRGRPLVSASTIGKRGLTFLVLGLGRMPVGVRAPAIVQPKGLPAEKVRNEIGEKIVAMDTIIGECESRFGRRVRVLDHPILGPLSAPQWRKLHLVHGKHHLKQLLQLRDSTRARMD